ncbi:N-6 DNA methylase [Ligilactobacillus salivarius]|uniref:N-6 DNA methylase n=1 Tax=Ligilactobacillus salivarius TaxID=1624 RepID=UPI0023B12D8F|nr:N-6 DNA methylase [Ligilactobacillus salivarius]MDE7522873.1 SAM-dependent methyltransferase [Ligilactobacillus salivarius]
MKFDVKTVNKLLGTDDAFKAPTKMMDLMLDPKKREETFKKFLEIETDMSYEWFQEYFGDEQAERKSKKQDFTPTSISNLVAKLVGKDNSTYYEPAAGTGSMLIAKWHNDRLKNPLYKRPETDNPLIKFLTSPTFTYDPRAYWYQAEELSDRAIPFLIFNMAIRGMNGSITQCDSLSRKATRAFFIRNDTDNYLGFSEVIELPKNQEVAELLNVHWD